MDARRRMFAGDDRVGDGIKRLAYSTVSNWAKFLECGLGAFGAGIFTVTQRGS